MIHLKNIFLQYGDRKLLNDVSFLIKPSDKIALIGKNGVGKTTLFKIITREITADGGHVEFQNEVSIGYLDQYLEANDTKTVWEVARSAFDEVLASEAKLEDLQRQMEEATEFESAAYLQIIEDYNVHLERVNGLDADRIDKRIELILKGLGFDRSEFHRPMHTFSGGWKMRAQFAQLLLKEPSLLLLDEPTNHLDIEAIIWLEEYIREYPGAIILISHDKAFLRNTASRILELELGKVYDYQLSYDKYEVEKVERRAIQESAFRNQQKSIAEKERTIKRFMAKATKTSMAQSMKKQLDKMERIELDETSNSTLRMRFLPVPRSGRTVLKAQGIGKSFGEKKVLENIDLQIDRGDRLCIVGQNGQGKTTLARVLLGHLDKSAGDIEMGTQLSIGYYAQNQSDELDGDETVLESMDRRAPEGMRLRVRSVLGAFMFSGEDVEKKISVLSGGEKARLALARMLMEPLNVLVLDEPTNHLDMVSKDVLKSALMEYEGTLIVVSHDRDFLADLTSTTIELKDQKMRKFLGDVNYFLEKKNLESLRAVAMQESDEQPGKAAVKTPKPILSRDDRRALQKAVKTAEKNMGKLELQIKKLEEVMAEPDFYLSPDAEEKSKQYGALKQSLSEAEDKWLIAVQEAEAI